MVRQDFPELFFTRFLFSSILLFRICERIYFILCWQGTLFRYFHTSFSMKLRTDWSHAFNVRILRSGICMDSDGQVTRYAMRTVKFPILCRVAR